MRRKLARAFTLSTLAALGALALAGQAPAADMSPSGALSRALHAYLERRSSYEFTEDTAALAATIELEREVQSVGPAMLEGEALVQRTILEERLEQAIARGLLRCEGRPSRLRQGPPPREGSTEEAALARRVERLAGTVSDLL